MLIVISGLPGTGKSTVAAALAQRVQAVHLSIDEVEEAMLGAGLARDLVTGVAAYEAVRAAAQQNLALGHHVIVDAVNDSEEARATWVNASNAAQAELRFVMLLPPPEAEHRHRLESRERPMSHLPEPTWEQVQVRVAKYAPWTTDCLRVDARKPVATLVSELKDALF